MRRELLAATALSSGALVALWQGPAVAQQVGATVSHQWTGFYIGGSVGAHASRNPLDLHLPDSASHDVNFQDNTPVFDGIPTDASLTPWPTHFDMDHAAGVPSVQLGYNYQIGSMLVGLEGDVTYLGIDGRDTWTATDSYATTDGGVERTTNLSVSSQLDVLATLRPRLGFMPTSKLLLFGTGGLAIGKAAIGSDADISQSYNDLGKSSQSVAWDGRDSSLAVGYSVGGGAEYALSDRVTAKFDGFYYDLGDISTTVTGSGTSTPDGGSATDLDVQSYKATTHLDGVVGRVGFTFRF